MRNDEYIISLLGFGYRYIDTSKIRADYYVDDGTMCLRIWLPWNSWNGQIYNLMDRVCVIDKGTGELLRCRVTKLSDKGFGSQSYIEIRTL